MKDWMKWKLFGNRKIFNPIRYKIVMKHKTIHSIAAAIFIIIALVHLLRIILNIPAQFGNWQAPMWISWIAIIISTLLSILLLKSSKD